MRGIAPADRQCTEATPASVTFHVLPDHRMRTVKSLANVEGELPAGCGRRAERGECVGFSIRMVPTM
jgi:hypothetical protein